MQKKGKDVSETSSADRLREAGLRPTRQRCVLADLLYAQGDRHVTAEMLYEEALLADAPVSLATIYNTLHQFRDAGLLRDVTVGGAKTYFDTNVSDHHHFYNESDGRLTDIPKGLIEVIGVPEAPDDKMIARIDVVVQLTNKK